MTELISCPGCRRRLEIAAATSQRVRCPACGSVFAVPALPGASAGEPPARPQGAVRDEGFAPQPMPAPAARAAATHRPDIWPADQPRRRVRSWDESASLPRRSATPWLIVAGVIAGLVVAGVVAWWISGGFSSSASDRAWARVSAEQGGFEVLL